MTPSTKFHSLVSSLLYRLSIKAYKKATHTSVQDVFNCTLLILTHTLGDNEVSSLQVRNTTGNLYNISVTLIHPTLFYKHKDTISDTLRQTLKNTYISFDVKTSIKPYER